MFDISFAELMLIGVVALLVIGPDKLPKVARTLGAYTGRLQRYVSQVKEEVNREINFEELQAIQQEIKTGVDEAKASIQDGLVQAQQQVDAAERSLSKPVAKASIQSTAQTKTPAKKRNAKKTTAKKSSIKNTVEGAK